MEVESTVNPTVHIPLHSNKYPGLFAVIDADDAPRIAGFRWNVYRDGQTFYAVRIVTLEGRPNRRTTTIRMHREILGVEASVTVDHWDGDGLNNTRKNLRTCTSTQNAMNRRKSTTAQTSFKGVGYVSRVKRWKATIGSGYHNTHLGYFATAEEAARAYDDAARILHGEFAHLNFPK